MVLFCIPEYFFITTTFYFHGWYYYLDFCLSRYLFRNTLKCIHSTVTFRPESGLAGLERLFFGVLSPKEVSPNQSFDQRILFTPRHSFSQEVDETAVRVALDFGFDLPCGKQSSTKRLKGEKGRKTVQAQSRSSFGYGVLGGLFEPTSGGKNTEGMHPVKLPLFISVQKPQVYPTRYNTLPEAPIVKVLDIIYKKLMKAEVSTKRREKYSMSGNVIIVGVKIESHLFIYSLFFFFSRDFILPFPSHSLIFAKLELWIALFYLSGGFLTRSLDSGAKFSCLLHRKIERSKQVIVLTRMWLNRILAMIATITIFLRGLRDYKLAAATCPVNLS